ncbi:exonuclease SbcC [Paenibacillus shirakamiensis]|uniref:Nuclease SbcCD subunit C n=1 Tax=Paenibacillus shirakamiensis TaxID=1265935 RepID=A0ABS4JBR6_9BACL|nr:SMC family ATPase [Paenibacillus shirakamiensis]MBP1999159.1 exonuclease SbcC [Paenibacillus shirakamiensis]
MRPIRLKLAGLQSYREAQEIDFTALCETGFFGIFGPTGSGKSTLLDAITLALYGKVERAVNGTQGIMNHSEDTLFVAFTFELTSAGGPERYRVERRFKRTGDVSVSNTISRFIEITPDGEQVKADKLAEVTRAVEEKIGLKMDDFTRAVVLPQGKFAEFLSLKGSERRQMLQRLFHLEQYGDLLGQKLSCRVKDTDSLLAQLSAEQQGLGSASEQDLKEAIERVKVAADEAAQRRSHLLAAETNAQQLGKLRELSRELLQRELALTKLHLRGEAIAALAEQLALAACAERLRPALSAWQGAQRLAAERSQRAAEAQTAAAQLRAAAKQTAAAAAEAQEARSAQEPALRVRLDQLAQAKALQAEYNTLQAEWAQLQNRVEHASIRRSEIAAQKLKEEALLAKGEQLRAELQQQLAGTEVKAADRLALQTASLLKDKSAQVRLRVAKIAASEQELTDRIARTQAEIKQRTEQEHIFTTQIQQARNQSVILLEGLNEAEHSCKSYILELEQYDAELKARGQSQINELSAVKLATGLVQGDPCPVCGSEHHPHLAKRVIEDTPSEHIHEDIAALLIELRERRYVIQREQDNAKRIVELSEHEQMSSQIHSTEDSFRQVAAANSLTDPQVSSLNPAEQSRPFRTSDPDTVVKIRTSTELDHVHLQRWQAEMEALYSEVKKVQTDRREQSARLTSLQSQQELMQQQQEGLRTQLQELQQEHIQLQQQWERECAGFDEARVDELQQDILAKDNLADELKARLIRSGPFIDEKQQLLKRLEQESAELDKDWIQQTTQMQGKTDLLQEKKLRLQAWIGDASVDVLIGQAEEHVQILLREEEKFKEHHVQQEQASQDATSVELVAQHAAQSAADQETELRKVWNQSLLDSPFTDESSVTKALLEPTKASSMESEVQEHREQERELTVSIRDLTEKLEGQQVSEEQWIESTQALQTAKAADELSVQAKARAERDVEDVEQRHSRWKVLEEARLVQEHEAALLSKLQSALRGNAFVEYMAEEQLIHVSQAASQRLRDLTKQRYSLETDSGGGFVICDDANGGVKRPVSSLSGGETFLTSLALALALSAQIQLRGQYPLQFFFLDEGFGTLDPELLDTVITSLEQLHHDHLAVGVISHVAELRARLPRKLVVIPAEHAGAGSRIQMEHL